MHVRQQQQLELEQQQQQQQPYGAVAAAAGSAWQLVQGPAATWSSNSVRQGDEHAPTSRFINLETGAGADHGRGGSSSSGSGSRSGDNSSSSSGSSDAMQGEQQQHSLWVSRSQFEVATVLQQLGCEGMQVRGGCYPQAARGAHLDARPAPPTSSWPDPNGQFKGQA